MAPKSEQQAGVSAPAPTPGQSAFCRRPTDRRLVRQVLGTHIVPSHWVPMDLNSSECKLMEVRKYSAEYNDIDTKFRKPHLELITAYAVQNPFLYGSFDLRKDQLKARGKARSEVAMKEKYLYFPTTFDNLESILQNGFTSVSNVGDIQQDSCKHHVKFYSSSVLANEAFRGLTNPRVMIVARVLITVCHLVPDETPGASNRLPQCPFDSVGSKRNRASFPVDTLTNELKTVFYKFHINEMYPDHVLVYRDLGGPNDERTSRLKNDLKFCYVAYRSGTRYNPDESEFKGLADREQRAEAAKHASQSAVGYYNAQTDIKVQEDQRKKSSNLRVAGGSEDENKKKKFSFMSILSWKSSGGEDAERRSKRSFMETSDPESQVNLKENVDNSNLNAIVEVCHEESQIPGPGAKKATTDCL